MKKISRALLLYQDTDSFVYLIPGSCPYELMQRAPEWFDFKNGKDLGWVANENSGKPGYFKYCLLYTSPSPRDLSTSRMPSSA